MSGVRKVTALLYSNKRVPEGEVNNLISAGYLRGFLQSSLVSFNQESNVLKQYLNKQIFNMEVDTFLVQGYFRLRVCRSAAEPIPTPARF